MSEVEYMTTAAALVEFYKELIEADLSPEIVRDLMAQAGHTLMSGDGQIAVRQPTHV